MADKEKLFELLGKTFAEQYKKRRIITAEHTASYLLENGVIVPPCKVGDMVYMVLREDTPRLEYFISEEKVTEVCSKGFHISDFFPPFDDIGSYISYEKLGKNIFFTREEAEDTLKERVDV